MEPCELNRWLSGDMTPNEESEYRRHLAGCPDCQEGFRERLALEDALTFIEAPMKTPKSIWRAIKTRVAPKAPARRMVWYALAGVSLAVLAFAFNLNQKTLTARPVFATEQLKAQLVGTNPSVHGIAVLNVVNHHLTVQVRGLHTLPAGHIYELWTIKGQKEHALGALNMTSDPATFRGIAQATSGYTLVICPAQAGWTARSSLGPVAVQGLFVPSQSGSLNG